MAILIAVLAMPAFARDYFIAPRGDDAADGLTPTTAKKSFAIAAQLRPGDILRLQRGGTWTETLRLPAGAPDRPIRVTAYGGGELPTIDAGPNSLDRCIDASAGDVTIDSLRLTNAAAPDRGAIVVWADHDLANISILNCRIEHSAGRGVWIAGEDGKTVKNVVIDGNTFAHNAGCGLLATKLDGAWVTNNDFSDNCSKTVDPWQAAVRVWSADVKNLSIACNQIDNGIHGLEKGAGMGIHVDETGPGVRVEGNTLRHCDAAGLEIENTRGVLVADNTMQDIYNGVFVYRAGHDHTITRNTIVARAQAVVLQGALGHGIDAGPEIYVDHQLITGNTIDHNVLIAGQWGAIKLVGGGENLRGDHANHVAQNAVGPDRAGLIEAGDALFNSAAATQSGVGPLRTDAPPFRDTAKNDLTLPNDWADFGARYFAHIPAAHPD